MPHFKYLILGGGMTADAAINAIRRIDPAGPIGMISQEAFPPYKRPPLTKGLWKGKPVDSIWLKTDEQRLEQHLGVKVMSLDAKSKRLIDHTDTEYHFDKLLLATGGTPRRFLFENDDRVIYYRTFADYERLRSLADTGGRFLVVGGGFIGSEIAAALAMNGKQVTLVFPEDYIGAKLYPPDLGEFVNDYYRKQGVDVSPGETVAKIDTSGDRIIVKLHGGRTLEVDGVVAGLGITPNTALAEAAGLKVNNGIHVDDLLRTNHPDIYAAGDVAEFYNPALGKHLRVEHEDNAVTMGDYAGRSMAGQGRPYHYLPYFYSDLFDLGYEAVGEVDSTLHTFADWKEPSKEGVIYYLRENRIRGVLLWNVWDKVPAARELIASPVERGEAELKGLIGVER